MSYELWAMSYELWAVSYELWAMSCELSANTPDGVRCLSSVVRQLWAKSQQLKTKSPRLRRINALQRINPSSRDNYPATAYLLPKLFAFLICYFAVYLYFRNELSTE